MIFSNISFENLEFSLNLFNFLFFIILTVISQHVPKSFHPPLFFVSGVYFIYHYSPISVFILIPSFLLISYRCLVPEINGKTMIETSIWTLAWLPFFFVLEYASFDHYYFTGMFPFEILVLGFYNLGRGYCIFHEIWLKKRKYTFLEALGYFWHPPILFAGPLETLAEWTRHHRNTLLPIQWKEGCKLLLSGALLGLIGEVLFLYATPQNLDFDKASYWQILIYAYSVGMVVHFRLAGFIHFTRGFSTLMGYPFQKPNFYQPYQSRSVTSFWSRWNMSVVRFAREYFFFRNFASFSRNKFLLSVFGYFLLLGLFHGLETSYALWGAAHGIGVIAGFLYLLAKYRIPFLLHLDRNFFPSWLKRALTLIYVHLSWVFLDPNWDKVFRILFGLG